MIYIIEPGVLGMVISVRHTSVRAVWYLDGIQYTSWLTKNEYIDYTDLRD